MIINIIAFVLFAADKSRAKARRERIPESILMFSALLGGCIGSLGGMLICRHKTRKPKFYIGVPLVTAAYVALAYFIFK